MDFQVFIKHGPTELAVTAGAGATVGELKHQLEQITGAFVRQQKLIFKGKVLSDADKLADCKISNGSKIMLLQTEGLPVKGQPTAPRGMTHPRLMAAISKPASVNSSTANNSSKGSSLLAEKMASMAAARAGGAAASAATKAASSNMSDRRAAWSKTGVVALRDMQLPALQSEWLTGLAGVRAADFCHNRLTDLPASLCQLSSLASLKLAHNCLQDSSVPWEQLCSSLTNLTSLLLGHNQLSTMPAELSQLSGLVQLGLEGNALVQLGEAAFEGLHRLETLTMHNNQLTRLPESLGCCSNLVALNATRNALPALPNSLSKLDKLQVLAVDNNRLTALPAQLFMGCSALATLNAHHNPVTVEHLRAMEGYAGYETRRQARATKQLEGRVMADIDKSFSEGADVEQWQRWVAGPKGLGNDGSGRAGK